MSSRRLPAGYLESLLPSVEEMIGKSEKQQAVKTASSARMRKVHFYIDQADYERLGRIIDRLGEGQGIIADRRGLVSKVLRAAVQLGLREIEERITHG